MLHTHESIFSCRKELKGLSHSERIRWFYTQKIVPQLSTDVVNAEGERQQQNHAAVAETCVPWLGKMADDKLFIYEKASRRLEELHTETESTEWYKQLAIGLAGLARILQVDLNSTIDPSQLTPQQVHKIRTTYENVQNVYQQVNLDSLPSRTIHGGAIHWRGEVTQDSARMFEKLGSLPGAIHALAEGTQYLVKELQELTPYVNLNHSTQSARSEVEEKYIGGLYALAVIEARYARLTLETAPMFRALEGVAITFQHQPNVERLATLSSWALKMAGEFRQQMPIHERFALGVNGVAGLLIALKINSREATRTVRSEFFKKR